MGSSVTPGTSRIQISHRRARLATAVGVSLLLAACGGGTDEGAGGGTGPTTATGDAKVVTVTEQDFSIEFSETSVTPGTYIFRVANQGATQHELTIKGPEVNVAKSQLISSGGTAQLTVTLLPGTYEAWCSVADHRAQGMDATITVG